MHNFTVEIDDTTFPGRRRHNLLRSLGTTESLDLFEILIHAAFWTTVPHFRTGPYCLWAVLRYLDAFEPPPMFKLVSAYDDQDFHQKRCLSEDLAVGTLAALLTRKAGIRNLTFVSYAAQTQRPLLTATGRPGIPRGVKTADYICDLTGGGFGILESKGGLSGLSKLRAAVGRGRQQKRGTETLFGVGNFQLSLAAGFFIPKARSRSTATLLIEDPPPDDMIATFAQVSDDELRRLIFCRSLASQLRAAGATRTAEHIAYRRSGPLDEPARREVGLLQGEHEVLRFPAKLGGDDVSGDIVVTSWLSRTLSELLLSDDPVEKLAAPPMSDWQRRGEGDASAYTVSTPLGVTITLRAPRSRF